MFKVGDSVRCVENKDGYIVKGAGWKKDFEFVITKVGDTTIPCYFGGVSGFGVYAEYLKLIKEVKMSLRSRIEALNNGWDKEADKIIKELSRKIKFQFLFQPTEKSEEFMIEALFWTKRFDDVGSWSDWQTQPKFKKYSTTQCQKMRDFKDALLWLLDKSGLEDIKVGNWVVANDTAYWELPEASPHKKGVHKIRKINRSYYFWDESPRNCYKKDIRLATQEEIEDRMPQAGDKVDVEVEGSKWQAKLVREK